MIWTEKYRGTRIKFCDTCGGCSAEIAAAQGGLRLRAHDFEDCQPNDTTEHHSHPIAAPVPSAICSRFRASIHCRSIITIAKPFGQHVRQPLRFDVGGDLQATWTSFAANRPRFFGMRGRCPHHIDRPTHHPHRAEAFAGPDTSEAATKMATTLRHQGSLLRKIVNRLSSSAMAKVTVSQVSRALMRLEPSLICRSWATTWARRLRMSRSSPTMTSPEKRRAKAHGQPGNRPWGSTRLEFDNRAPSAPNAGSASHAKTMVCVRGRSGVRTTWPVPPHLCGGQSDLMMHYDMTVNDDCEIRLGDQTSYEH